MRVYKNNSKYCCVIVSRLLLFFTIQYYYYYMYLIHIFLSMSSIPFGDIISYSTPDACKQYKYIFFKCLMRHAFDKNSERLNQLQYIIK